MISLSEKLYQKEVQSKLLNNSDNIYLDYYKELNKLIKSKDFKGLSSLLLLPFSEYTRWEKELVLRMSYYLDFNMLKSDFDLIDLTTFLDELLNLYYSDIHLGHLKTYKLNLPLRIGYAQNMIFEAIAFGEK